MNARSTIAKLIYVCAFVLNADEILIIDVVHLSLMVTAATLKAQPKHVYTIHTIHYNDLISKLCSHCMTESSLSKVPFRNIQPPLCGMQIIFYL